MSANCPKCGSDQLSLLRAWITDFECGSTLMLQDYLDEAKAGDFKQSKICRELSAANAEIERLEQDKARYHDKWLNCYERLFAARKETARLRQGVRWLSRWSRALPEQCQEPFLADIADQLTGQEGNDGKYS